MLVDKVETIKYYLLTKFIIRKLVYYFLSVVPSTFLNIFKPLLKYLKVSWALVYIK